MEPVFGDLEPSPEACARALYLLGHSRAAEQLRQGLHPDAVRCNFALIEELLDARMDGATWRGIEDALAGRRPAP
jgi:hypothetical protein